MMTYAMILTFIIATLSPGFVPTGLAGTSHDIDQLAAEKLVWIQNPSDREQVVAYARSGKLSVQKNSSDCPTEFPDAIGSEKLRFCGQVLELPDAVLRDLHLMARTRFDNISDYDQRVTRFAVMRHNGDIYRTIQALGQSALRDLINVPSNYTKQQFDSQHAPDSVAYLFALQGLHVGYKLDVRTSLLDYVTALSEAAVFYHVSFGPDPVQLYPGGGFTVRFNFYLNDTWFIYAKTEGWDS